MRRKIRKVTIALLPKGLDDKELEDSVKNTLLGEGLYVPIDKRDSEKEATESDLPAMEELSESKPADTNLNGPDNLAVADYSTEEIEEDTKAVDWEKAFEEV